MRMWKPWILLEYLGLLSVWDARRKEVPVVALIAGAVMDLLLFAGGLYGGETTYADLIPALLGLFPGAFLLVLAKLTGKAGEADGIALAIVGAAESYAIAFGTLCTGSFLASLYAIVRVFRKKADRKTELPFLPFLAIGYFVCGVWRFGQRR